MRPNPTRLSRREKELKRRKIDAKTELWEASIRVKLGACLIGVKAPSPTPSPAQPPPGPDDQPVSVLLPIARAAESCLGGRPLGTHPYYQNSF